MSLINDALKKAQRQRGGDAGSIPMSAGGMAVKRGLSTQAIVLIGIGALVLVSLSVVFTVFLTSSSAPVAPPAKVAPLALSLQKMRSAPAATNPVPTIVFPSTDKQAAAGATNASLNPTQATAATSPLAPAPTATFTKSADQIQDMVDKFRVAGVRSSSTGSKVLMNDHIVKLNEVVDREIGLRLVKIEDSSLTFEDAKGTLYTKDF